MKRTKHLYLAILLVLFYFPFAGCSESNKTQLAPQNTEASANAPTIALEQRPSNSTCLAWQPFNAYGNLTYQNTFDNIPFNAPVAMRPYPGDDTSWIVAEQGGEIIRVTNNGNDFSSTTFLDLSDRFHYINYPLDEHGIADITFHPDFLNNGKLYIYYKERTVDVACQNVGPFYCPTKVVLSSFTLDPNTQTIDPNSEEIIFNLLTPTARHQGGSIVFGPDGYLYIGLGDSTINWEAQDFYTQHGSILRIDVDQGSPYSIPPNNPLIDDFGAPEIFAWGFRNPWRMSFDRLTGELWTGDFGENKWEEIDNVEIGKNYGWRLYEGEECIDPPCELENYVGPISEYSHEEGCGVIGGFVYRGTAIPQLYGSYLFGDLCTGTIWSIPGESSEFQIPKVIANTNSNIVSFSEDNDGELYILDISGKISKITGFTPAPLNSIPNRLSETGCFKQNDPKLPTDGLIPYSINMPFWSDGAVKERWMAIPDKEQIVTQPNGKWKLPVGSVLAKTFKLNDRFVETRLLMQSDEGQWNGYTYEWNQEQTEAFLVQESGKIKFVEGKNWIYPSRNQCLRCHNPVGGPILGLEAPQLNRKNYYPQSGIEGDQLLTLAHIGMLANYSEDDAQSETAAFPSMESEAPNFELVEEKARTYLHVNCAFCHQPDGPGSGPEDFRYFMSLQQTNTCENPPTVSDLGIQNAALLSPGHPETSILFQRMNRRDEFGMPPIGSNFVDGGGASLLQSWIEGIQSCE